MGDRSTSGWKVSKNQNNGTSRWLLNEIWTISHESKPEVVFDDYQIQGGNDYIQVVGVTEDYQTVLIIEDKVANGWSLQIVAGGIEPGQTPEEAAHREFKEESGWSAKHLVALGSQVPQTDRIISRTQGNNGAKTCYMFLATGLTPGEQSLGDGEKIKSILVPWSDAFSAALTGEVLPQAGLAMEDCGSRLAILVADSYLRKEWLHI